MTFRLVDRGWESEFVDGLLQHPGALRIVCPFIKRRALARILSTRLPFLRVITRFSLPNFAEGVSDIQSLRLFLDAGGAVRGVHGLHAKLYVFGTGRAIITSANLTGAGLTENREFGVVTEDSAAVERCLTWFDALWQDAGNDLQHSQLDSWTHTLSNHLASSGPPSESGDLGDFGAVASFEPLPNSSPPPILADSPQAFVKFLGEGNNRVPLDCSTIEEIDRAGCHWALAWPAGGNRRPTGVEDGAVMFVSRLVKGPDIRIFGRAVALKHEAGRDDATPADIERRPWKAHWSRYIRVHHAEFVAGTMQNGVSLAELMNTLGSDSFAPTQRNAARGQGNTNPRRAFMQQPAVELSHEGFEWLNARLQTAFDVHGQLRRHVLRELDWPELPAHPEQSPDFTQDDFNRELLRMLDAGRQAGRPATRIVARDLHRNVVGGTEPNRFPMACDAMWKLWRQQGSIPENIVRTTESGRSSTIEIEFSTTHPARG